MSFFQLTTGILIGFVIHLRGFGSSFFIGTGGSGVSLDSYSTIFQFILSGGLIFRFGL